MKELYRFRQFLTEEDFKNPILDKYLELKKSIDYKTVFPTDLQSFVDSLDNTEREGLENDLAEGVIKEEQMGSYGKFLKVVKSYEDEEILSDFLDSYPKGQDISKSEYERFTEKHLGLSDPEDYRGENWKYIMSESVIKEGVDIDQMKIEIEDVASYLEDVNKEEEVMSNVLDRHDSDPFETMGEVYAYLDGLLQKY